MEAVDIQYNWFSPLIGMAMCCRLCQLAWFALHVGHPTIHILELQHSKLFHFLGLVASSNVVFIPHNTFCSNVLFGGTVTH